MPSSRRGIFQFIIVAILLWAAAEGRAQAPTAIQLFLPGGGLPGKEVRFTLTRDDGRIEILFTDSKGKFQLTGDLARDSEYTIEIAGDGRTFDTTTARFRIIRNIVYIPVFLRPLKGEPPTREVVDVASFDAKAPEEAKAAYSEAMKAVGDNDAATAISEFTRALSIYPKYLRALNDLGVLYLKLSRLDEAALAFTQAISLNPRFHFPRLNLGVVYNRQGKYGEAADVLEQLVKDQPALSNARVVYAESLIGLRQMDEASEHLRAALKDPGLDTATRAEAHFGLGMLFNREERYAAAAAEMEKLLALSPTGPYAANACLYLGGAQLQLKKLDLAEKSLLKAYEMGGSRVAGAQLFLGQLYHIQQKYELSLQAFERYLKDMPDSPNAPQIKTAIEQIKTLLKK
jgi:tetratricopeptide (TPR) repeat protein